MLDGLTPDLAPRLLLAIGVVGVALLVLIFVLVFLKRRNSPLFIKGGKSREPRLMVLDAAAVDPKRRLVLIRRDDVEHLIMIGGPTDIVIESGIGERQPAVAGKAAAAVHELPLSASAVAAGHHVPAPEIKPAPVAAAEARTEPDIPKAVRRAEQPGGTQAETKPVSADTRPVQPEARPAQIEIRPVPAQSVVSLDSLPGRSQPPVDRSVSAMGPMLYDEDREPMTGNKPARQSAQFQPERVTAEQKPADMASLARQTPVTTSAQPAIPVERQEPVAHPATAVAAETALDQARARVLSAREATGEGDHPAETDPTRAIAARLEAARTDAMRRVQSAQPASQFNAPPIAQPATAQPLAPPITIGEAADASRAARDAVPSDFEKLLEAELDASGIFGAVAPQVKGETRQAANSAGNPVAPAVRPHSPITGATPDLSSEEEVARLLGEIAVNRKS